MPLFSLLEMILKFPLTIISIVNIFRFAFNLFLNRCCNICSAKFNQNFDKSPSPFAMLKRKKTQIFQLKMFIREISTYLPYQEGGYIHGWYLEKGRVITQNHCNNSQSPLWCVRVCVRDVCE